MGFWKNLFSGTDSSASDQDSKFRSVPNCDREILFSSDRNLEPISKLVSPERIPLTDNNSGTSEQIAQLVLFLSSDASSFITGTEIWIDGATSLI